MVQAYGSALLLLILILGLAARNGLVSLAAAILLLLGALGAQGSLRLLSERGIPIGLAFLTLAVLAPIARGDLDLPALVRPLLNPTGLFGIVGGLLAAWISARGLDLLARRPEVVLSLLIGTMLGTTFLQGLPVGPLFAAGITALLLRLIPPHG